MKTRCQVCKRRFEAQASAKTYRPGAVNGPIGGAIRLALGNAVVREDELDAAIERVAVKAS
ncbi:MAG: hypothetical protein WBX25_34790 [Rhodomicrobium sp.]